MAAQYGFDTLKGNVDAERFGTQVLRKVQIRNAKEVFWDTVSVDQRAHP
jgi:hypothetical protein